MTDYRFKVFSLLLVFTVVLQSCSKDQYEIPIDDPTTLSQDGGANGPPNNNGPGNQNPPNEVVSQLDHQVATDWMSLFLELDRYATGMRPNATARAIAYINLAAYETAVPGMRDFISNNGKIRGLRIRNNNNMRDVNWQLALNACYADVMDHFIRNVSNNSKSKIGDLEAQLQEELSADLSTRIITASQDWGAGVARQIIEYSQTDAAAESQILEPQPLSYEPPTGDGFWTYSAEPERALFPYWGSVRTFVVSTDQTTTLPPESYSENQNSNYYHQMIEVYNANNSAKENDDEQLWIAEFWSDDVENLVFSPPGRQVSISNQLIENYAMNLEEALYLYLKLGYALNDAAVSTWKYKYEHMVMRPNVFIHEFIDPSYQTNLYRLIPWPNPTFPGYPSGHSCFASAAAGVFIDFFGEQTNFTDRSHQGRTEFRGSPRSYTSFRQMADENGYSRIPLGVHVRMDCTEGIRLGYEISDQISKYDIKRKREEI